MNTLPFNNIRFDYYWNPGTYMKYRCSTVMFTNVLPEYVTSKILAVSNCYGDNCGVIWCPFHMYFFECTILYAPSLCQHYIISFITQTKRNEVPLLKATHMIDATYMRDILGKGINQEDEYCHVPKAQMKGLMKNLSLSHTPRSTKEIRQIVDHFQKTDDIMFSRYKCIKYNDKYSQDRESFIIEGDINRHFSNGEGGIYLKNLEPPPDSPVIVRLSVSGEDKVSDPIRESGNQTFHIEGDDKSVGKLPESIDQHQNCVYNVIHNMDELPNGKKIVTQSAAKCHDSGENLSDHTPKEVEWEDRVGVNIKKGDVIKWWDKFHLKPPPINLMERGGDWCLVVDKLQTHYNHVTTEKKHRTAKRIKETHVKDTSIYIPRPVGFRNTHHSCYANFAIQILSSILPFWKILTTCKCVLCNPQELKHELTETTVGALLCAISGSKYGTHKCYDNTPLSQFMGYYEDSQHQDFQQFMTSLLEDEITNDNSVKIITTRKGLCKPMKKRCNDIFGGTQGTHITCKNCKHEHDSFDKQEIFQVAIPLEDVLKTSRERKSVKIRIKDWEVQKLFTKVFEEEHMDDEDNLRQCFKCGNKWPWLKKDFLVKSPNILFVIVGKTYYDVKKEKMSFYNMTVQPPSTLEYKSDSSQIKYILFGKVHQKPSETDWQKGHFTCDVMDWLTGTWFNCDDDIVKKKGENNHASKSLSYMYYVEELFFKDSIKEELDTCTEKRYFLTMRRKLFLK